MPSSSISAGLLAQLRSLALSPSTHTRPQAIIHKHHNPSLSQTITKRQFSSTPRTTDWLLPRTGARKKTQKGRPQVNTGASTRGTVLIHGDYGLRLASTGWRLPAKQLSIAVEAIKRRLKGTRFKLYPRIAANIPVYTKGNEQRMGKGKGGFDYWCARIAHGRVVFEIGGDAHEQVVKEALRIAANKLPGQWEFIRRSDREVVGATRLKGDMTKESLFRPKRVGELHPLHLMPDGRRAGEIALAEQRQLDDTIAEFENEQTRGAGSAGLIA